MKKEALLREENIEEKKGKLFCKVEMNFCVDEQENGVKEEN